MASSVDTVNASSSSTFRGDEIAFSSWCLAELVEILECRRWMNLTVVPVLYHVDPSDVGNQRGALADAFVNPEEPLALSETASIPGSVLNYSDTDWQSINESIGSLCNLSNQMPEDGSTNWDSPPRFDVTPDESDDADDDADEMVHDYIGLENESLSNLSNREAQVINNFIASPSNLSNEMLEDGSVNLDLPRFDDSQDEADNDAGEMVQDYVTDLPQEAHVEPDDVADAPQELPPRYDDYINDAVDVMQEAHVEPDDVADAPQEAHVEPDDVADAPQEAHVVPDDVADAPQEAHVVPDDVADAPQEAHVVPDDVADAPQEAHVEPDDVESLRILSDLEPQLIDECNEPLSNLCDPESQWIDEFIESPSNHMVQDGSTNWDSPPRFDATPDESDDAVEIVQDYVADLPLEAHVVPDDVADLLLEAHVVEDHVANLQLEAYVVPDDVADAPQEAHVVEDHVANLQLLTRRETNNKNVLRTYALLIILEEIKMENVDLLCPICDNAIRVALCCGHMFCEECGNRCSTCPICRDRIHIRIPVFPPQ
ncbi:uncharacterized protein LOC115986494 isoform X4 [Quercus lobata]|uniref:uncharacterized protein LOC115986494 isoform X4 n=1 Tax=Quercus lobata TaxID=97700 RepID=UPI001247742C|nr:uncharacterized protein LOC115986494 isoform X4 [Quercus lobata]